MVNAKFFSFFIIISSLLAVGIFGFLWIDNTDSSHAMRPGCPIPLMGGDCPIFSNAVGMVWHHIASLQNSILSTVNLYTVYLLFLNLVFLFFLFWRQSAPPLLSIHLYRTKHTYIEHYHLSKKEFLRWLILCRTEASLPSITSVLVA